MGNGTGTAFEVTGTTALNMDVTGKMQDALVPCPVVVVGPAFLLPVVLRSVLVSRMPEAYVPGEGAEQAVLSGFRHGGRIVATAAPIMTAVSSGLMTADDSMVRTVGSGLAGVVLFDAVIVRMVLVPAVLAPVGSRASWLRARLDRLLPRVDVEGEALSHRATDLPAPAHAPPQDTARV